MATIKTSRAIFLDRDGVINEKLPEGMYVTNWELFKFLPGVKEAVKKLTDSDYKVIIVSNQRGIALGHMTQLNLEGIHKKMINELEDSGGKIDAIYFCPHDNGECKCRKPLPGMLDRAKDEFNIDFKNSWVIGDSDSDIKMGLVRGCKTALIKESNNASTQPTYQKLIDAVDTILGGKQ